MLAGYRMASGNNAKLVAAGMRFRVPGAGRHSAAGPAGGRGKADVLRLVRQVDTAAGPGEGIRWAGCHQDGAGTNSPTIGGSWKPRNARSCSRSDLAGDLVALIQSAGAGLYWQAGDRFERLRLAESSRAEGRYGRGIVALRQLSDGTEWRRTADV